MAKHKHIDGICIGITLLTLLLTLLFMNGKALGLTVVASEENSDAMFTANDLEAGWDPGEATKITLSDEGSRVDGNGAYVHEGDVYIVYGGKYVLSGELSNGSVLIDADGDDKIWLMLDGVSLHCEEDAAIRVEQADKVFLTLGEGTENLVSTGASFCEEAVSAGVDGAIYSRDDLTIQGAGSLSVMAGYQHGIVCNDDLVITGGTLSITAVQDAIHANDSVRIKDADLMLSAGDDGITVSNDEETSFIYVESGNIAIPSCYEGLEAVQVTIAGGTLVIAPVDDGINATGYGDHAAVTITGGDITITNENGRDADGIDSNHDIMISGGRLFISVSDSGGSCAIDCGSEYGGVCEVSGGTILACGSSGMAEGFAQTSAQGFLMQTVSAAAGTTVTVKDVQGNELLSETVPCRFSSVLVSMPEMKVGDTCTLVVGDTETEMTIDNSSSAGGFGGGRLHGGIPWSGGTSFPNRNDDDSQGDIPQDIRDFGGRPGGGNMPELNGNMPDPNGNTSELNGNTRNPNGNMRNPNGNMPELNGNTPDPNGNTESPGIPVSGEALLLLGVSVMILLAGCVAAACYKRRG